MLDDRIFGITDRDAPNRRIVEIRLRDNGQHEWVDIVPDTGTPINNWLIVGDRIFVSYMREMIHQIWIFDFSGKGMGELPISEATKLSESLAVRQTATSFSSKRNHSLNPTDFSLFVEERQPNALG